MTNKTERLPNCDDSSESRAQRVSALIAEFERNYPTEQDCLTELFRLARIADRPCRFCNHPELEKSYGSRAGKCHSCNRITWFTAGTWLHHIKKAKARLAAIYLAENGEYLSSPAFARAFKTSQSSAFVILRWLSLVIENLMPDSETRIHSSLFTPVFCKRSKETPAGCHPSSEQERAEEEKSRLDSGRNLYESVESLSFSEAPSENSNTQASVDLYNPLASAIMELLSKSPISFDELCQKLESTAANMSSALVLLELEGAVTRLAGDRYVRAVKKTGIQSITQRDKDHIDLFFEFIKSCFHGISRKYLQGYLALYWCRSVLPFRARGLFMQSCLQGAPISSSRNYVTPLLVQLEFTWKQITKTTESKWSE